MLTVTLLVVHLLWTAWDWISASLAARGAPPGVLLFGALLFGLWVFGVIMKLSILMAMPSRIGFVQSSVEDVAGASLDQLKERPPLPDPSRQVGGVLPLDALTLETQTRELESLGFERVTDFKVEGNRPLPPGFARLLVNREHRCRAELHQVFPQTISAAPTLLTCAISSVLCGQETSPEFHWSLETSNGARHAGSGIAWAMRHPRRLWSRHPGSMPSQVLAHHLECRSRVASDLRLTVCTDLSWEGYCEQGQRALNVQCRRLLLKSGVIIWLENLFCKNKTEWWGDYARVSSRSVSGG